MLSTYEKIHRILQYVAQHTTKAAFISSRCIYVDNEYRYNRVKSFSPFLCKICFLRPALPDGFIGLLLVQKIIDLSILD